MVENGNFHIADVFAGLGRLVWLIALFSVLTNFLVLTGPFFMIVVYDRVLPTRSEEMLLYASVLMAVLISLYGVLEFARSQIAARMGAGLQMRLGAPLVGALFGMQGGGRPLALQRRLMEDLETLRRFFTARLFLALFDLFWTPLYVVLLFVIHPKLGWLAVAGGSVLCLVTVCGQALTWHRALVGTAGYASQSFAAGGYIRAQALETNVTERWAKLREEALRRVLWDSDGAEALTSFGKAFRYFLQSAMLALGAFLVLEKELSGGFMIACSIILGRALAPLEQVLAHWRLAYKAVSSWRRIGHVLAQGRTRSLQHALPSSAAGLSVCDLKGAQPDRLGGEGKSVSFCLEPGEVLGVIGRAGAGKTELVRSLLAVDEPLCGDIRFGDVPLAQYDEACREKLIGYLPQDLRFFEVSVAENIARMSGSPDMKEVIAAAREAGVHDVILSLPDGYGTVLDPLASKLASGYKMQLALARAVYGRPKLLVFDEPDVSHGSAGADALRRCMLNTKLAQGSMIVTSQSTVGLEHCTHLMLLEEGKVTRWGKRERVWPFLVEAYKNAPPSVGVG